MIVDKILLKKMAILMVIDLNVHTEWNGFLKDNVQEFVKDTLRGGY